MAQMSEFENALLAQALTDADGSVSAPTCCGVKMVDDGGCGQGCCDDYKCSVCGETVRIEWPD